MAERTIFFATTNPAKLAQLRWVAQHMNCTAPIHSAVEQFGDAARYQEVGHTETEIAQRGAQAVAARIGVPVLTEDTGFYVAALGGKPGIYAGRFLKANGRQQLLTRLKGESDRRAEIVSAVAYARPDGECILWEHRVPGQIAHAEQWTPGLPDWIAPTPQTSSGGGYNAIFIPCGERRTLAKIPPIEALSWGYREPNFVRFLKIVLRGQVWYNQGNQE